MTTTYSPNLRRRRGRIIRFFARVILSAILWDLLLRNLGGRRLARRTLLARYVRHARRFRDLAVELGGVMIKLGQFVSSRVDILPIEIINELAGLQDEVPVEPFDSIRVVIESELGQSIRSAFLSFDDQAIAAASLGQVHSATLPGGEDVVVKVLRPGIESIIDVDLDALRWVVGWLKRYRPISRRADLDALYDEFRTTLYEEMDYVAEGHNAEHFAIAFDRWERIRIPTIHWTHSTRRVLTMEDIRAIKISDVAAFEAKGVKRQDVAKTLFEFYLEQIFTDGMYHADPHPGNLFVEPLDDGRFTLNVVDFGMVGRIAPALVAQLRDGFIGVALRDPRRLVQSMNAAGWLLPSADIQQIERAVDKVFSHFWGINMGDIRNLDLDEARQLVYEFRQLLYEAPFQIPSNVLFLGRALGILSGLATSIDPQFNVFATAEPFARKMVSEQAAPMLSTFLSQLTEIGTALVHLPTQFDRVIGTMLRGELRVTVGATDALIREVHVLNKSMNRLIWTLVFSVLLLAGIVLEVSGYRTLSPWVIGSAIVALLWMVLWGFRR
jgi:predicted unusual protein kinase regulating ubiquinone biosynthesis (AarF/ABC1/UbiB family)